MSKRIEFKIDVNGGVKVDKVCGMGSDCLSFTKSLEDRLGGVDESSREMTEEFNEPVQHDQHEAIEM
jgi:hypothetical protein